MAYNKNIINIDSPVIKNDWSSLRKYTDARIGLGRAGSSLPSNELLSFQLSHAKAQDAVYLPLDIESLYKEFAALYSEINLLDNISHSFNIFEKNKGTILLHSKSKSRSEYLQRPDFGRVLDTKSKELLKSKVAKNNISYDLAIVVVDGLSSLAIKENASKFIQKLSISLQNDENNWSLAPLIIVEEGRVAIGDEIGELLEANCILVLIGERPGLSSPNSMGLYLTWNPKSGLTDSRRNCISNIRLAGLSYEEAVNKSMYLLKESRRLKISGVKLKDRSEEINITKKENKKLT